MSLKGTELNRIRCTLDTACFSVVRYNKFDVTAQAAPCNVGAALTGNRPCGAAAREVAAALVRIPTGPLQGNALQPTLQLV